jgi:hypothetical protein
MIHFLLARHSHGVGFAFGPWSQPEPLEVQTVWRNGSASFTRGAYSTANATFASGSLITPGGAVFHFSDAFSDVGASAFTVSRAVTVAAAGDPLEYAFSTRFTLPAPPSLAAAPRELFIPGVSYENASALLPRGALAGDPFAAHVLVREDRLPLPLVAAVWAGAGAASLLHLRPDGRTLPNEDFTARIVDGGLQFGSLGVVNAAAAGASFPAPALAFEYPGSEGDRTYVYDPSKGGWANRSHPLTPGFSAHAYVLRFSWAADGGGGFHGAARGAWRGAWAALSPPRPPAPPPAALYAAGMDVLSHYAAAPYRGVSALPFEARLPDGAVVDPSSQMGFVGRALPAAALLLFDALVARPNATRASAAAAVADVWAESAPTPCGAVRTWFDVAPGGALTWRAQPAAYHGSLRIMCDGMKGLVDAAVVAGRARGGAWLTAAARFGDFLVAAQRPDGSLAAAYGPACEPLSGDVRQTAFAVPLLLALANATGRASYGAAAARAGAFAAALFGAGPWAYAGGAPDNPDVPDREAGWLHAQAFLALFDATGDATWLVPAARAADYAETWVFGWAVPIPCAQVPSNAFPCSRSTLGASLIAAGQSGADNFMAVAWWVYVRLGKALGDDHYVEVGEFLYAATAQVTDYDGTLGYAMPGLLHEAFTPSVRRGSGVFDWLPWLTTNILEPLVASMLGKT